MHTTPNGGSLLSLLTRDGYAVRVMSITLQNSWAEICESHPSQRREGWGTHIIGWEGLKPLSHYCTVRVKVVVCEIVPEVAVTVTVDVPTGTGVGPVEFVLEPEQPARLNVSRRSENTPPSIAETPKLFLFLRIAGKSERRPRGSMAPAATFDAEPPGKRGPDKPEPDKSEPDRREME